MQAQNFNLFVRLPDHNKFLVCTNLSPHEALKLAQVNKAYRVFINYFAPLWQLFTERDGLYGNEMKELASRIEDAPDEFDVDHLPPYHHKHAFFIRKQEVCNSIPEMFRRTQHPLTKLERKLYRFTSDKFRAKKQKIEGSSHLPGVTFTFWQQNSQEDRSVFKLDPASQLIEEPQVFLSALDIGTKIDVPLTRIFSLLVRGIAFDEIFYSDEDEEQDQDNGSQYPYFSKIFDFLVDKSQLVVTPEMFREAFRGLEEPNERRRWTGSLPFIDKLLIAIENQNHVQGAATLGNLNIFPLFLEMWRNYKKPFEVDTSLAEVRKDLYELSLFLIEAAESLYEHNITPSHEDVLNCIRGKYFDVLKIYFKYLKAPINSETLKVFQENIPTREYLDAEDIYQNDQLSDEEINEEIINRSNLKDLIRKLEDHIKKTLDARARKQAIEVKS